MRNWCEVVVHWRLQMMARCCAPRHWSVVLANGCLPGGWSCPYKYYLYVAMHSYCIATWILLTILSYCCLNIACWDCIAVVAPKVFFPDRLTQTAGHRFRFTGPVGPVTGGNRLNSNPNSNKFKSSRATGSDRFTGRFDRFIGRFDWFEFKSKFKSSRATGLPTGLIGLPAGLTGGP